MKAFKKYLKSLDKEELSETRERFVDFQNLLEYVADESNSETIQLVLEKIFDMVELMDDVEEEKGGSDESEEEEEAE